MDDAQRYADTSGNVGDSAAVRGQELDPEKRCLASGKRARRRQGGRLTAKSRQRHGFIRAVVAVTNDREGHDFSRAVWSSKASGFSR